MYTSKNVLVYLNWCIFDNYYMSGRVFYLMRSVF